MRIILDGEQRLRVQAAGPELEVEAKAPGLHFSPLHMLAASLATCTLSVLASWALQADLAIEDLEIDVSWDYVPNPYRVGNLTMVLHWPGLPESRQAAALRAADHCTVENTLTHSPTIQTRIAA